MEIDPAYSDVIVRRFIAMGESAVEPEVVERYRVSKEVSA